MHYRILSGREDVLGMITPFEYRMSYTFSGNTVAYEVMYKVKGIYRVENI